MIPQNYVVFYEPFPGWVSVDVSRYGMSNLRRFLNRFLSAKPNPKDVLQMLMSQDPDDETEIEAKLGLCMARVDFISHRLADELISIVKEWNESLHQPQISNEWFGKLEKWDKPIARLIHYSIPSMIVALSYFLLGKLFPNTSHSITTGGILISSRWLLVSLLALYVFSNLGKYLASKCYMAINEYGIFTPFKITRGDENRVQELNKNNRKKITAFCLSVGVTFILNILAGIVVWIILPK